MEDHSIQPLLTGPLPGTGGRYKAHESDFQVEELPLYPFSGQGTHHYFYVEKQGLTTQDTLNILGHQLGIRTQDIGYAGLKDAKAVTRQWLSIEHIDPQRVLNLNCPNIRILQHTQHQNKIKLGHLSGNHFKIRIRDLGCPLMQAMDRAREILNWIQTKGCPNFFGPQRFGKRHNAHLLGQAILRDDRETFFSILLGQPTTGESAACIEARVLYEKGDYPKAHDMWPHSFSEERRLLSRFMKFDGNINRTFRCISKNIKRFYVSAYQSHIFNLVLMKRLSSFDRLLEGDIAYKHENGACFPVHDASTEQPRCDRFEISPTGPIFGPQMKSAFGPAGQIENPILIHELNSLLEHPEKLRKESAKGGRRPLRIQPKNTSIATGQDDYGQYLELIFDLPSGSYATVLLHEIMKSSEHDH